MSKKKWLRAGPLPGQTDRLALLERYYLRGQRSTYGWITLKAAGRDRPRGSLTLAAVNKNPLDPGPIAAKSNVASRPVP